MTTDEIKQAVAKHAAGFVTDGTTVGLGTGSTANHLLHALAERMKNGLQFTGVPTSEATKALALQLNIPVADLDHVGEIHIAIDGADEIDHELEIIKGGGGAFLREKMVEYAAKRFIVIADETKFVKMLGKFPLPVEVVPYGIERIKKHINSLGCSGVSLRNRSGKIFVTDHGHHVLDCEFHEIPDPKSLNARLKEIPGVVETGLFLHMAHEAVIGYTDGSIKLFHASSTDRHLSPDIVK